jgi:hypothetical protein
MAELSLAEDDKQQQRRWGDEAENRSAWEAGWEGMDSSPASTPPPSAEEVDAAFVAALEAAESVLTLRQRLTERLGAATFGISQARYSLGANRVGQAQYPSSIEPSFKVKVGGTLPESLTFSAVRPITAPMSGDDKATSHDADKKDAAVVSGTVGKAVGKKAPLSWFGVVTPPGLRTAQSEAGGALEIALEIAGAQVKLQRVTSRYRALLAAATH